MPNIASLLKTEILRLARKEVRLELEGLKKASARHRSEIAELKRQVKFLQRQPARPGKRSAGSETSSTEKAEPRKIRFSTSGFAALRKKLGLSASDMGLLLGVSSQTIYNWEKEITYPRQPQLETIASLRGVGKREAKARLSILSKQE